MSAPLAAITGGTGFLGRYVVRALAEAGWRVRLLTRRDPAHPLLDDLPLELELGDLGDSAALDRLVRGAAAVVHAAGLIKALRAEDFVAVNVGGSAALAGAVARTTPGARLVVVSSQAARAPGVSPYAASKRAGEDAAVAAAGGAPWVVVRPCAIYGAWDDASLSLLRLAALPAVPTPRGREPRLAMIHAADAAAAIAQLCRAEAPAGARFELCDARTDGYGWRELLGQCAAAIGRPAPPRFLPLPDGAFRLAGAAAAGWAAATRRAGFFGPGKVGEMLHRDWAPDPAALLPPAVWQPHIGLPEGLAEMAAWDRRMRCSRGAAPG
ncbi:NAD-dependent epimerase/dehydratase family protein [Roseomonas sp. BN140053]|uniref:NAD-dependent epimerase/dehydratase family protein n=1 Tax=Roseomonas sp. BN140053 TaxID=3391898 RepID=UPI0039EC0E25